MGLDTFAAHSPEEVELSEEDLQAFSEADISLCCGVLSGGGNGGNFREKVYSELIYEITGRNLYAEWLPPETVNAMYASLVACDPKEPADWDYGRNTARAVLELRKFYKVCVDRGLGLVGWR
ncbi:hypothetical protein KQH56_02720 [bacterium]|nr:hypothetical protein [bacterium]